MSLEKPLVLAAIAAFSFGTLTACARPPQVAAAPAPSLAPAPVEAPEPEPAPAGELACKTKDAFGVVTELYLSGEKGTLRRVAPSGTNEEQPLHLERHGNALFGDRPQSEDLAVHAVTLRTSDGKSFLRLGDWNQSWSSCL